jgi:uncharacterized protein (TIGR02466 family)
LEAFPLLRPVLWKGHYDGDVRLIEHQSRSLLTTSKRLNTGLEMDGGVSSSSDPDVPHDWKSMGPFVRWIYQHLETIWQDIGYKGGNVYPHASWANLHPPGAWTSEHQHGDVPLVVVLYVKQPENGGNLEIFDPLFYNWAGTIRTPQFGWTEIPVQTGDVLVFPGWILHRTQKNQSDTDRIVISINFRVDNRWQ